VFVISMDTFIRPIMCLFEKILSATVALFFSIYILSLVVPEWISTLLKCTVYEYAAVTPLEFLTGIVGVKRESLFKGNAASFNSAELMPCSEVLLLYL